MAQTQVTTFLQNQERYDISFKNTGVIEYGVFDNEGLAESVDNQRDPFAGNTDIIDSDLSASQTEFSIIDLTTGDKIFSGCDHDDFEAKIRELAAAYQEAGKQDA